MAPTVNDSFTAEYLLGPCSEVCKATFAYHSEKEPGVERLWKIDEALAYFHGRLAEVVQDASNDWRRELILFSSQTTDGFKPEISRGIAILFQTLRCKLQKVWKQGKEDPGTYMGGYGSPIGKGDTDQVLEMARSKGHWLQTRKDLDGFMVKKESNIYAVRHKEGDTIAAFALAKFYERHIELLDIIERDSNPAAKDVLLGGFHSWIPGRHPQMQSHLTTRPLDENEPETIQTYRANGFLAFGGGRNEAGELTHVILGKLTDKFRSRAAL